MNNHLETFIKNNKMEFDALQPSPAIWGMLETNLVKSNFLNSNWIKGKFNWLKYFVLSSAIVGTVYYFNRPKEIAQPLKSVEIENSKADLSANDPDQSPKPIFESAVLPVIKEENERTKRAEVNAITELQVKDGSEKLLPKATITFIELPKTVKKNYRKAGSFLDTIFAGIQSLEINANRSDINIVASSSSDIIVNAEEAEQANRIKSEKNKSDLLNLSFEKNGSKLLVSISKNESSKLKIKSKNGCLGTLNIEVPESINVFIKSAFGNVSMSGLKNGNVDLILSSGDVNVRNCETSINSKLTYGDFESTNTSGNMDMTLSSGDAHLDQHSGDISIRSSFGDQLIQNVRGNLNVVTSSGDVSLKNVHGDCKIVSSYGDIKLDSLVGNPTIISSSGDIKGINVQLNESLSITSSYGDVNIDILNELSSLNFDLQSKRGDLKVDMENQVFIDGSKLVVPGGPISVKTVTSSGDQIFR